jgi:hypothetical protein
MRFPAPSILELPPFRPIFGYESVEQSARAQAVNRSPCVSVGDTHGIPDPVGCRKLLLHNDLLVACAQIVPSVAVPSEIAYPLRSFLAPPTMNRFARAAMRQGRPETRTTPARACCLPQPAHQTRCRQGMLADKVHCGWAGADTGDYVIQLNDLRRRPPCATFRSAGFSFPLVISDFVS